MTMATKEIEKSSQEDLSPFSGDGDARSTVGSVENFQFQEDRKLGVTSAVFLILNKMIGTGSMFWQDDRRRPLNYRRERLTISI